MNETPPSPAREAEAASLGPVSTAAPTAVPAHRLAALDWMRGFVMILMAVDHASATWNGGRVAADSAYLLDPATGGPAWIPGTTLDLAQFLTRWITHLCAPTFLFLSGTSLAMSLERRRAQGASEVSLDRHLLMRAAVILALEGLLTLLAGQGVLLLQVLYAIGTSMLAMIILRRLPTRALLFVGLAWLVGSELVVTALYPPPAADTSLLGRLLFVPGFYSGVYVLYPMTHWLAMMLLGWAFGRHLLGRGAGDAAKQETEKLLLFSGLSSLLISLFLRRWNLYGNMGVLRDDASLVQWLHMSKYPPALVYSLFELGLMALFLVLFLRYERRMEGRPRSRNPLLVFGQTALFFYFLHFLLLGGSAMAITGGIGKRGLLETYLAAAGALVVLYPVCLAFRALKRRHPNSILQYV
ncbi:heparan-alpha-glucosaminide N-acetyltransferase domain-containing protein [Myxococcota bacterium]|nr:heparan-alpha-glucosaminide N-acetyltransferase domain-containing protein [Myxococcota bacterium]